MTDELLRAGFNQAEIFKALDWLEQLAQLQHSDTSPYLITDSPQTMRIFTDHECKMLDVQRRNFLMFVERIGVTNGITREIGNGPLSSAR